MQESTNYILQAKSSLPACHPACELRMVLHFYILEKNKKQNNIYNLSF